MSPEGKDLAQIECDPTGGGSLTSVQSGLDPNPKEESGFSARTASRLRVEPLFKSNLFLYENFCMFCTSPAHTKLPNHSLFLKGSNSCRFKHPADGHQWAEQKTYFVVMTMIGGILSSCWGVVQAKHGPNKDTPSWNPTHSDNSDHACL